MAEKYEFNRTQYNQLVSFRDTVKETGVVCKQQVVSLEAAVGVAIVTRERPIDMLSEFPTKCCASDITSEVDKIIENVTITDIVKTSDLIKASTNVRYELNKLKELLEDFSSINDVTLSRMNDTKYTSWYDKESLLDIAKDRSIQEVIAWNSDYMKSLADTTGDINRYDVIWNLCENFALGNNQQGLYNTVLPLISMLLDAENLKDNILSFRAPFIKTITLSDIVSLIKNAPVLVTQIEAILGYYENDKQYRLNPNFMERYYSGWDNKVDGKYVMDDYNSYQNLHGLLSDPASRCVLSVIAALKQK